MMWLGNGLALVGAGKPGRAAERFTVPITNSGVAIISPGRLLSVKVASGSPPLVSIYDSPFAGAGIMPYQGALATGEKASVDLPIINGVYVDMTSALGPELVTNGNFNTDVSGWAPQLTGATITWRDGKMELFGGSGGGRATQTVSGLEIGETYVFRATMLEPSANSISCRLTTDTAGSSTGQIYGSANVSAGQLLPIVTSFVAAATSITIAGSASAGVTGCFDKISLRKQTQSTGTVELEFAA
ncbi:hypothetical protein G3A56_09025 [Rhizobium oryzihabitans]|uniref:Uncharacterized protein n=1 Tax=Rhizobium oryzihabitans TaxID=2267833 RepID=A0A7L5BH15_9HYPH|nr:hypothetical protein [Rhizobium oryzihabitans]QIB38112.1 hypothetical protein G3A56_09025 [Rhizobium oryzihabitans]